MNTSSNSYTPRQVYMDMIQDISSKPRLGVKVVLACAGARNNEPSEFIEIVHVLVTSPPRLLKLVGQARLTSMDRCCHLVVEEGDRTLSMWHKQVGGIKYIGFLVSVSDKEQILAWTNFVYSHLS